MGPVLKRITMNYPPVLFHPINSITAYKGQVIYDTPETEAKAETPVPYLQWQNAPGVTPPEIPPDADLSTLLAPPAPEAATSPAPEAAQTAPPAPLAPQPIPGPLRPDQAVPQPAAPQTGAGG